MNATEGIVGRLFVRPGWPRPQNLRSTRPDWVHAVTRNRLAKDLPPLLAGLFGLCGRAHYWCAKCAVFAACGQTISWSLEDAHALRMLTLREHVRSIWMDWPLHLLPRTERPAKHNALQSLAACPLFPERMPAAAADTQVLADFRVWLEREALAMPLSVWLNRWEQDASSWLQTWTAQVDTPVAGWLRVALAEECRDAPRALRVHAQVSALQTLASDLVQQANFNRAPTWHGRCAATGPWARLHERAINSSQSPGLRLAAKLAEVIRLALPCELGRCGSLWLNQGQLTLAPQQGLAWVEMARGLLLHWLVLDGAGPSARVQTCQVLAPTEWNFHPLGSAAQALEAMLPWSAAKSQYRARVLMASYDPCVPFTLEAMPATSAREVSHHA